MLHHAGVAAGQTLIVIAGSLCAVAFVVALVVVVALMGSFIAAVAALMAPAMAASYLLSILPRRFAYFSLWGILWLDRYIGWCSALATTPIGKQKAR